MWRVRATRWAIAVASSVVAAVCMGSSAAGYTGGPVRVLEIGYDSTEAKILWRTDAFDESGDAPQVWYVDLNGSRPTQPIRAPSLEVMQNGAWMAWARTAARLKWLRGVARFDVRLTVAAESTGVDRIHEVPRYKVDITLATERGQRNITREAFCQPLVRVRALYDVPGRSEQVAVISCIGRAYGCEEVEEVVVVPESEQPSGAPRTVTGRPASEWVK